MIRSARNKPFRVPPRSRLHPNYTTVNRLFLVRHGENLANITKEFSHKILDYNLTEKGHLQAKQTTEYFQTIKIDAVYSSPLKRAIQTAEYIAKSKRLKTEILENFREVNIGDLELTQQDNRWEIYFSVTSEWFSGNKNVRFPNGENYHILFERFWGGLMQVTENMSDKNIIIVGHSGIFTAGIIELCSIQNKQEFADRLHHNCSISEILLKSDGKNYEAQLLRWGDHSHLSGDAAEFINGLPDKK